MRPIGKAASGNAVSVIQDACSTVFSIRRALLLLVIFRCHSSSRTVNLVGPEPRALVTTSSSAERRGRHNLDRLSRDRDCFRFLDTANQHTFGINSVWPEVITCSPILDLFGRQ